MAWGKAGSDTLTSAVDTLTVSGMTASKFNQFMCHAIGASGGNHNNKWNFNNDSGSNYAIRKSLDGAGDSTSTSQTNMYWHDDNASTEQFSIVYAIGTSSEEKLVIHSDIDNSAGTGAGTAPRRTEGVGKWANTSDTIDRVDKFTTTGNEDTDSNLSALGSDLTPATAIPAIDNVQDNSLFVEKENARRYWFSEALAPTFEDNTFSSGWTSTGSDVVTGTNVIDFDFSNSNATNTISYDLGSTMSDTNWVLRFKLIMDNYNVGSSGNSAGGFFGLFSADHATNDNATQDSIMMNIRATSAGSSYHKYYYADCDGETPRNKLTGDGSFTHTPTEETLYVEIKRTSSTAYTINLYSDSSYSTLVESKTGACASTVTGLRYIKFMNLNSASVSDHDIDGTIDDVEFYNGVTTPTPATWTMNPTYEDDFSSSTGWTTVGSNISITGGAITASSMTTQSENRIYKPLGFTIADDFLIQFEFEETAISHGAHYMLFTLTAGNGNINNGTNQDAIQVWVDKGSPTFFLRDKDGTSTSSNTSALTISNSTRYYVTLVNNNRTVTYTVRTGSHTGTVVGTNNITLQSGITGLTHIQSGSLSGNSGTTSYTLDNLKIYNGVTSVN